MICMHTIEEKTVMRQWNNFVTYYKTLRNVMWQMSFVKFHQSNVRCHLLCEQSHVTCQMLSVSCQMSTRISQMSYITCQMSSATCNLSNQNVSSKPEFQILFISTSNLLDLFYFLFSYSLLWKRNESFENNFH